MKIFLLSGQDRKKGFAPIITKYINEELSSKRIMVCICTNPSKHDKNDIYLYGNNDSLGIIKTFKDTGIEKFYLLDDRVSKEEAQRLLYSADVINLLGGNPFSQLEFIKNYELDNIIKNFNGVMISVSAGTMNLAKKSYYSKDEDYTKSAFYDGLGIVDITIDPHFNINDKEQVEEAKRMSYQHEIIGLPDSSGIIIDNNEKHYIGEYFQFINGELVKKK